MCSPDRLPSVRLDHRPDINYHHLVLGPADVDIGFARRDGPGDPFNQQIAGIVPGDEVIVSARQVKDLHGHVVGKLASKTRLDGPGTVSGTVSAILVRTRDQTQPEYMATVKTERWETVLVETVVQGPRKR
mgnify:FL=1